MLHHPVLSHLLLFGSFTYSRSPANACAEKPCRNGGVCADYFGGYSCDCGTDQFEGKNCETRVYCDVPSMRGGYLTCTDKTALGSECLVTCTTPGYGFSNPSAICENNGWSARLSCSAIYCLLPVLPHLHYNGCVLGRAVFPGKECGVFCDSGYHTPGPVEMMCQESEDGTNKGVWDSHNATCIKNTCTEFPPQPNYASSNCTTAMTWTDRCTVECAVGYEVADGNYIAGCELDGQWLALPVCTPLSCGPLPAIANATLSCSSALHYGDNACTVTCDKNTIIINESPAAGLSPNQFACVSAGADDAVAYSTVPQCREAACGPVPLTHVDYISCNGTEIYDTCTVSCAEGYILLTDEDTLTCQRDLQWSNLDVVLCKVMDCGVVPVGDLTIPHGTLTCPETTYGSTCAISCVEGFESSGTYECFAAGWSSTAACVDVNECLLGTVDCGNGACNNTVGSYECVCDTNWYGKHCNQEEDEREESSSTVVNQDPTAQETGEKGGAGTAVKIVIGAVGGVALLAAGGIFCIRRLNARPKSTFSSDDDYGLADRNYTTAVEVLKLTSFHSTDTLGDSTFDTFGSSTCGGESTATFASSLATNDTLCMDTIGIDDASLALTSMDTSNSLPSSSSSLHTSSTNLESSGTVDELDSSASSIH